MTTLIQEIKQGLEAAFQMQLEEYKTKNTANKDQLIWDGATLRAKQDAWVRWVENNGKMNCDGVDKTPIELSQLETVLNKKCSELESKINGILTGTLLKDFADTQYLYLNVVESDNSVKVIELTMKIRPTVSVEAAKIYHFDDETNDKVEEHYKNKLKLKKQNNEPTITVSRLKKSDKSLTDNIVELQTHLLNQTKLNPKEEQKAFTDKFQTEPFIEQPSPQTPSNSSPVNELEDEQVNITKATIKRARTNSKGEIDFESGYDENLFVDEKKHSHQRKTSRQIQPQNLAAPTRVELLKKYIYKRKNTFILSTVTSFASAALFTTLYFTLQTLLPMSMVIACAAFASLVPIVIAAGIYFEMKPSWFNHNAGRLKTVKCKAHPLNEEVEIEDFDLTKLESSNDRKLSSNDTESRSNDTNPSADEDPTVNVMTYLRNAKLTRLNEMKTMTIADHSTTDKEEFSPKENRGLPNPNL